MIELVNPSVVVICSGGCDPLHRGHIAYFKAAKRLGDKLIVALNSDAWLCRKKGKAFMTWSERACIIAHLKMVDDVIGFDDTDGSAKDAIHRVRNQFPHSKIIFANGGDRTAINIPEMDINDDNLDFAFGVGGEDKLNSSSWILRNYVSSSEQKPS